MAYRLKILDLLGMKPRCSFSCLFIHCSSSGGKALHCERNMRANGAAKNEIGHAKEFIVKQFEVVMGDSMELGTIHAGDFLSCFCSHLGMTNQTVEAAQEALGKSEEVDVRSPISIVAYRISQLQMTRSPKKVLQSSTLLSSDIQRSCFNFQFLHRIHRPQRS